MNVARVEEDYLITKNDETASLELIPRRNDSPIAFSGASSSGNMLFLEKEGEWYSLSGNTIAPLDPSSHSEKSLLGLETVSHIVSTERYHIFF